MENKITNVLMLTSGKRKNFIHDNLFPRDDILFVIKLLEY